ncbi:MAG: DUF6687 family protein [Acidimicrobiales bacterium]
MSFAGSPRPLPFVACGDLGDVPHVVVDGAASASTVLSLSHWPMSPTPRALGRDLSAEIAFAYLDAQRWWCDAAQAVTNDHVDQDGLASLYVLTDPEHAREHKHVLVEIARAGDFAVVDDDDAAQAAFALAVLGDPQRSPLVSRPPEVPATSPAPPAPLIPVVPAAASDAWSRACYPYLLDLLPRLVEQPRRHAEAGDAERCALEVSRRVLAGGRATITEIPSVGLAVVAVDESVGHVSGSRFCHEVTGPLHPAAIHGATRSPRVLVVQGRRYRYYDRYETWVRYESAALPRRRDLGLLARELSARESAATEWHADSPGTLEPELTHACDEESSLELCEVIDSVVRYLAASPPAWDPFAGKGPFVAGPSGSGPSEPGLSEPGLSEPAASTGGTSGRGRLRSPGRRRAPPST